MSALARLHGLCFLVVTVVVFGVSSGLFAQTPLPPAAVEVHDHAGGDGTDLQVVITLPDQQVKPAISDDESEAKEVVYIVRRSGEYVGVYEEIDRRAPTARELRKGRMEFKVGKNLRGEPYWFRVAAAIDDDTSTWVQTARANPIVATRQAIDYDRLWLLAIVILVCGSIMGCVGLAWIGLPMKVRQIAGLEAVEEAVGRATEMGKSCLFVPGLMDMNDMQTIAGLTILSRVAEQAADYDSMLEVPTSRSLVMTAARETMEASYFKAGRPDAYQQDNVYYVTDEQFAFVSFLSGKMVREKPAACFYLGAFYAESLILAETGNSIGAIQVAGTAQPAQLPFFVAACDYTLIGEEFFAASAYLSGDPVQVGSLKGQDLGKLFVGGLILVGVALMTCANLYHDQPLGYQLQDAVYYLKNVVLESR